MLSEELETVIIGYKTVNKNFEEKINTENVKNILFLHNKSFSHTFALGILALPPKPCE